MDTFIEKNKEQNQLNDENQINEETEIKNQVDVEITPYI